MIRLAGRVLLLEAATTVRILLVTNSYSRVHVVYLARALAPEHHVHVVSFDKGRDPRAAGKAGAFASLDVVSRPIAPWRDRLRTATGLEPLFVSANRSPEMEQLVLAAAREREYDLAVFEPLAMAQYGRFFQPAERTALFAVDCFTRARRQLVGSGHSAAIRLFGGLDFVLTRRYEKFATRQFPTTTYVSSVEAQYAIQHGLAPAGRVKVLPLAVDTGYFVPRPDLQVNRNVIVFFANLGEYKSAHGLMWFHRRVWPFLKRRLPALQLKVVGVNASQPIRDLARQDRDVILAGFTEDLREHVLPAACVIVPLVMGAGMKNRVLEALAMGKAVVTTPAGIEGLRVSHNNELLLAKNASDFAECVLSVVNDAPTAENLGLCGRAYVEREHTLALLRERFLSRVAGIEQQALTVAG